MSLSLHSPAGDLIEAAAQSLARNEAARLPDLTAVTVLLPNLNCATRFSAALFSAASTSVILLPKITTLTGLTAASPTMGALYSRQQRVSDVYHALRHRDWLAREELWSLAYEVVAIVDELNAAGHGMPQTPQALQAQLQSAYRASHEKPLDFEAKLLFELWYALSRKHNALDAMAMRHLALARIAAEAQTPLYTVGIAQLSRREESFLHAYAENAPVYRFDSDDRDYRQSAHARAICVAAWAPYANETPSAQEAGERIDYLRTSGAPKLENLILLPARSLEHQADNLARVVRHWLGCGHQSICIVALDRLLARRLRALLERERIAVDDEAGWALSTTRAAGIVMGLARADHPQAAEQLAYLSSALSFAGQLGEQDRLALSRLEQALLKTRKPDVRIKNLASRLAPNLIAASRKLDSALRRIGHKTRPLALWNAALIDAIDMIGLRGALQNDEAGNACLMLLESLRRDGIDDANVFEKSEWLQWLDRELEAALFRQPMQGAAVTFTHLAATRLRRFDCVAFAGADDKHLPGAAGQQAFFNEPVRRALGLPHYTSQLREMESLLIAQCSQRKEVVVSWQQTLDGEINSPSRYFSRLDNFHRRLFGVALPVVELSIEESQPDRPDVLPSAPTPSIPPALLPQRMSASAANSLIACPYQFYAKYVLRLSELTDDEDISKRDYGSLIHRILYDFHKAHPQLIDLEEQACCDALAQMSVAAFSVELERDFTAQAWLIKWQKQIPGYVAWQRQREHDGWRWYDGEVSAHTELRLTDDQCLILNGRIDRIDVRYDDGVASYAIFDYKSKKSKPLVELLAEPGEDIQLPFYALLQPHAVEVAYIALDDETLQEVAPQQPIAELSVAVSNRLRQLMQNLATGAALPAHGDSRSCELCSVRVVCRRDYW